MCSAGPICEGGRITYYRIDPTVEGGRVIVREPLIANQGGACTYTLVINDLNKSVYASIECPDPSSPTGYGPEIISQSVSSSSGFIGFTDPNSRYAVALLTDADTCTSITGTVYIVCNPGSNTTGTVQSSTGTYAVNYPVGTQVNPGIFAAEMPVIVNNVTRHVNPVPGCGNPTGFLVRLELT
jgi:hypothetical protein